ncbi:MAG: hypothetical protein J5746_01365 [Victivallales bacterium]|nr:hypothetical protein [Victivallales bacterium]
MLEIVVKISRCWERMACAVMTLLCILCILCFVLFMLEAPSAPEIKGKKPMALRIFPWDSLSGNFFTPAVPDAGKVNPFQYVLVNRDKPVPKPVAPPEKEEPKVKEMPKAEAVKPIVVAPPHPPPKKPDIVFTLTYKGIYVDLRGDSVALVSIRQGGAAKEETLMCKTGTVLMDRIRLEKVVEDSATFSTKSGQVRIDWMKSHQFRFPQ